MPALRPAQLSEAARFGVGACLQANDMAGWHLVGSPASRLLWGDRPNDTRLSGVHAAKNFLPPPPPPRLRGGEQNLNKLPPPLAEEMEFELAPFPDCGGGLGWGQTIPSAKPEPEGNEKK